MIINNFKIVFLCLVSNCGKINTEVLLEVGWPDVKYNSPTKVAHQNVTTENGKQYVNYKFILAEELGAKIGVAISIEYAARNKYVYIRTQREKNACRTLSAFGGETWAKVQRAAGVPPKKCPIKPGVYVVPHLEVVIDPISLEMIPIGKVRINYTLVHNADKKPFCGAYVILTRTL